MPSKVINRSIVILSTEEFSMQRLCQSKEKSDGKYCPLCTGCRISPFGRNDKRKSWSGRASARIGEGKAPGLDQGGWLPLLIS
jgi:hypothetical protein